MFTWICPQCGREVPPAYDECPDCAKLAEPAGNPAAQAGGQNPAAVPPRYPPPEYATPGYPPPQPPVQPAPSYTQQIGVPTQQGYPQPQPGYYPPQPGYPPQQPGYPPQQQGYQQPGYPPQAYPPQQGYPPPQPYAPQPGYPPQQPGYPPPQYPPQQGYAPPPQQSYAPPQAYPPPVQPPAPAPPADQPSERRPGPAPSFLGLSGGGPPISTAPSPAPAPDQPPALPRPSSSSSFLGVSDAPSAYGEQPATPRRGLPTWLLTFIFIVVLLGVVGGAYWLVGSSHGTTASPAAGAETAATKAGAQTNPYQKYIEISGVRFVEDAKKRPAVMFVIVNHSPAPFDNLEGKVTVRARTQPPTDEPTGTVTFKVTLGPNQSKEVTEPLDTKLKFYELPDWQLVTTDFQIKAPGASGG